MSRSVTTAFNNQLTSSELQPFLAIDLDLMEAIFFHGLDMATLHLVAVLMLEVGML